MQSRHNIVLLIVAIFLSLVISEALARHYSPPAFYPPKGLYKLDPKIGCVHTPNFTGYFKGREFKTKIKINSKGLRDYEYNYEKDNKTFRIIAIGDSFTEGIQVDLDKTYPKRLEVMLNGLQGHNKIKYEVINMGVGGYGHECELLYLKEEGLKYHPDLIIVGVYLNDITEGKLPTYFQKRPLRLSFYGSKIFLRRHSRLYSIFADHLKNNLCIKSLLAKFNVTLELYIPVSQLFLKSPPPSLKVKWHQSLKDIIEMSKIAEFCNSHFLIVAIPKNVQVYPRLWERAKRQFRLKDENYDLERPQRILQDFCIKNNIPHLDLLPYFKKELATGRELYFRIDPHWNDEGHNFAAEKICAYLVDHKMLRKKIKYKTLL